MPVTESPYRRVVLAGFMGSGKTTVGRLLAQRLRWSFADLDDEVSRAKQMSVPDIFAQQGEAAFRAGETAALRVLLQTDALVIALGGGAPETSAVQHLLAVTPQTLTVHLHAPLDTLYARCMAQASDPEATARPLLGSRQSAEERYRRRRLLYGAAAQLTVDVHALHPQGAAEAIAACISPQ